MKTKNDPRKSWHCQSDNGTFGLYYNGHNFFPDAGVYAYSGGSRTTYAQTKMHNTLTVQSKNLLDSERKGQQLLFTEKDGVQIVVTQNDGVYDGGNSDNIPLKYRRSVFHDIENRLFVIVDEADGEDTFKANTNLNFHLCPDAIVDINNYNEGESFKAYTEFPGSNIIIRSFFDKTENIELPKKEDQCKIQNSNTSNNIGVASARKGYSMTNKPKTAGNLVRFISVIYYNDGDVKDTPIEAKFVTDEITTLPTSTTVEVKVNNVSHSYTYDLSNN